MTLTAIPLPELVLLIFLLVLATHRGTRFVTRDKIWIMSAPREAFVNRWGAFDDDPGDDHETRKTKRGTAIGGKPTNIVMASLAYLWECDWCASVWIGSLLTYLTWRWPETMLWVLVAIVASTLTGLLALVEKRLSGD